MDDYKPLARDQKEQGVSFKCGKMLTTQHHLNHTPMCKPSVEVM